MMLYDLKIYGMKLTWLYAEICFMFEFNCAQLYLPRHNINETKLLNFYLNLIKVDFKMIIPHVKFFLAKN